MSAIARVTVRADHIVETVSVSDAFAVEFKILTVEVVVDQPDRLAGNHFAVLHRDELRHLNTVVNDKAGAREASRRSTRDSAYVFLPFLPTSLP
jgi:hypothetical protein